MDSKLTFKFFLIIYFLIFIFCLIIYPAWYVFDSNTYNLFFCTGLMGYLIIFLFIIRYLFLKFKIYDKDIFYSDNIEISLGLNDKLILFGIFIIYFFINYFPVFELPIQSVGDQFYHSYAVCPMIERADGVLGKLGVNYEIAVKLLFFILILLYAVKKIIINILHRIINSQFYYYFYLLVFFCSFLLIVFLMKIGFYANLGSFKAHIFQYPTMSKIPFLIWYGLFGVGSGQANSVQLVLTFLAGIFFYKIIFYNFKDRYISVCGLIIYLFVPLIFYFAHTSYLSAGEIFLVVGTVYYYQLWADSFNYKYLLKCILFAVAGNLYRSSFVVIVPAMAVYSCYLVMNNYKIKGYLIKKIKLFVFWFISFISILFPVWLIIKLNADIMPEAKLEKLWTLTHLLRFFKPVEPYFPTLQDTVTYPILFLAVLGILLFKSSKINNDLKKVIILGTGWFAVYYTAIVTAHSHSVRHLAPAYPALILISLIIIFIIFDIIKKPIFKISLTIIFGIYLLSLSIVDSFIPLKIVWSKPKYNLGMANTYFRYDLLFDYIKNEIPFNENFFAPMICEPVDFYSYVSKIKRKRFVNREFLNRKNTGINDVVAYMIKNNINYFILPYLINAESPYDIIIVPNHTEIKWIEKKEFQMLLNFPNNDFSLVNKWEFEKFGLALFKINKSNFL